MTKEEIIIYMKDLNKNINITKKTTKIGISISIQDLNRNMKRVGRKA
jgi:hypothetical protein